MITEQPKSIQMPHFPDPGQHAAIAEQPEPVLMPQIPQQAAHAAWQQAHELEMLQETPRRFYETVRDRYAHEDVVQALQAVLRRHGANDHKTYALTLPHRLVLTPHGFLVQDPRWAGNAERVDGWENLSAEAFRALTSAPDACAALDAALTRAASQRLQPALLGSRLGVQSFKQALTDTAGTARRVAVAPFAALGTCLGATAAGVGACLGGTCECVGACACGTCEVLGACLECLCGCLGATCEILGDCLGNLCDCVGECCCCCCD